MQHDPLGSSAFLSEVLAELAKTIDARAGGDPESSWTAKLLMGGPALTAKKLGEEGVEAALAGKAGSEKLFREVSADLGERSWRSVAGFTPDYIQHVATVAVDDALSRAWSEASG